MEGFRSLNLCSRNKKRGPSYNIMALQEVRYPLQSNHFNLFLTSILNLDSTWHLFFVGVWVLYVLCAHIRARDRERERERIYLVSTWLIHLPINTSLTSNFRSRVKKLENKQVYIDPLILKKNYTKNWNCSVSYGKCQMLFRKYD